jgi:hypothetical protein
LKVVIHDLLSVYESQNCLVLVNAFNDIGPEKPWTTRTCMDVVLISTVLLIDRDAVG